MCLAADYQGMYYVIGMYQLTITISKMSMQAVYNALTLLFGIILSRLCVSCVMCIDLHIYYDSYYSSKCVL